MKCWRPTCGKRKHSRMELGYCCRGCKADGCCTRDCENQPFVEAPKSPGPAVVLEVSHEPSSREQEPPEEHNNIESNNVNIEMKVLGFMDTASPLGPTWEKVCQGRAPTVDVSTGMLMGKWGECLAWAVAYETQHPDWTSDRKFFLQTPAGQVIEARAELSHEHLTSPLQRTSAVSTKVTKA